MTVMASRGARRRLLPSPAAAWLWRRLCQLAGLALIAAAAAAAAAIASHTQGDPSLNTATAMPAANLLGVGGAIFADIAIQWLGAASLLLAVVPAVWGLRCLILHPPTAFVWRLAALPMVLVLTGFALGLLVAGAGSGDAGGVIGGWLVETAVPPLLAAGLPAPVLKAAIPVLAVLALMWCLGISLRELLASVWPLMRVGFRFARRALRADGARAGRLEPRLADTEAPAPASSQRTGGETAAKPATPRRRRAETAKPSLGNASGQPVPSRREAREAAAETVDETGGYQLPATRLLAVPEQPAGGGPDDESLKQNAQMLEAVLGDFNVRGQVIRIRYGPVVTLYELEPAPGTKSARVIGLADDIARSMSAVSVRVAVVPGRNAIGIELPNASRETVFLREMLESDSYRRSGARLPIALGKDIGGGPIIVDLARMPHLLIAGTTGSGKSVAINTMILSLLYRLPPERCRMIMIDPKMLELSIYDGIPHLLCPVVTDPKKAVVALKWTVREMENRYQAMSRLGVRNIEGYNLRVGEAARRGEVLKRRVQTGFDSETGKPVFEDQPLNLDTLPQIVVVIDEMADLMLVAGKEIEGAVQRLAQMARAAGIHVIMATQRPSVDVITGTIKANFPTRVSFQVTSKIDSRTILGEQGAEQLLGQGDMLYMAGGGRITRVHGPFCSDEEVEEVARHLRSQGEPDYDESITEEDGTEGGEAGGFPLLDGGDPGDDLYDQAVALVAREGKASTSFVQRHLKIGYNRAATLIERMESEGVVSRADHVGRREVLVGDHGG